VFCEKVGFFCVKKKREKRAFSRRMKKGQ